ncbi:hypothetical protein, partial [Ruegeria arenilitoris]|uniref:hypothetical protein n=1 Tax=Ruegeria arenilitoris TaxID=1173585 RepID=UPI001C2C5E6B
ARQAHNLKVAGSNPPPATKTVQQNTERAAQGRLCSFSTARSAPTQKSPTYKRKETRKMRNRIFQDIGYDRQTNHVSDRSDRLHP